ncbi:MAG TPA: CYTH domain-containing protein [Mucilaginibacter sp.]|nr:CYTH domain-containing protein [Mucilaginibacter sp.]
MGVEIERKFLVDHEKWGWVEKPGGTHYRQGYILSNEQQTIRIRISDTQAFLNLKSKESEMTRKEYEYEIPLNDGIEIMNSFTKNGTEKVRYRIPFAGKVWEVDEFLADNSGLIVAEIELGSETEEFKAPDWITVEVTDDGRYTNAGLSIQPFCNW